MPRSTPTSRALAPLSRKTAQVFKGNPADEAALAGESYYPVTYGHIVTRAFDPPKSDSHIFDRLFGGPEVDARVKLARILEYLGVDRSEINRGKPLTKYEVQDLEDGIAANVSDRLMVERRRALSAWAEQVIENLVIPDEQVNAAIREFQERVQSISDPSEESRKTTDKIEDAWEWRFNEADLRYQVLRSVSLLQRDGFVTTLAAVATKLEEGGFTDDIRGDGFIDATLINRLAHAVFTNVNAELRLAAELSVDQRLSGEVLLPALEDGNVDFVDERLDLDAQIIDMWVREGMPVVMGKKDLAVFIENYTPAIPEAVIEADPEYQAVCGLFMNTPKRIADVHNHIAYLADRSGVATDFSPR